jgi:diguanylate cyclase (GGDEF)-like protein
VIVRLEAPKPEIRPIHAEGVTVLIRAARDLKDARREIDALRTQNARLQSEISQLKEREAQTLRLADEDELTGLYNRRRMLQRLESAIALATRHRRHLGLLFIDLDGFKEVNDEFGHAMGDGLLKSVGARIAARARSSDIVCRYGGDEFVVVLPELSGGGDVQQIAETLRWRLSLPYSILERELRVTASVGTAFFPDDGATAEQLLQRADAAMYQAKSLRVAVAASPRGTAPGTARRRTVRAHLAPLPLSTARARGPVP